MAGFLERLGRRYAHANGKIPWYVWLIALDAFWEGYTIEIYETCQFEEL